MASIAISVAEANGRTYLLPGDKQNARRVPVANWSPVKNF
jgi:hypothetical protein